MRTLIIILTLFLWVPSFAQKETVFKVSAPKTIMLIPNIDTLLYGQDYYFTLEGIEVYDIARVNFTGGKVLLKGSGISLFNLSPGFAGRVKDTLRIYSKNNKYSNAIFEKEFSISQFIETSAVRSPSSPRKKGKFKYGRIIKSP